MIPLASISARSLGKRMSKVATEAQEKSGFLTTYLVELFKNHKLTKIFQKEKFEMNRAENHLHQLKEKTKKRSHLATNIVVQCQNQRSQLKNKQIAMKLLKSKLFQFQLDAKSTNLNNIVSDKKSIEWGSQIRSYVFHPYNLVKDHRTNHETSNINEVMDGEIDSFVRNYLINKMEY